ncbi:MAG: MotA/TolQ/ExbB proton channel family protein [Bacteroidota bacterium]|nr:MotA/TolQ/ExbB proton channel family protein [Bacteroidota bacterium]
MILSFPLLDPEVAISNQPATTLLDLLMKGGVIMIPIVLLSLISIYIFIERLVYIRKLSSIDRGLIPSVVNELKNGKPGNAIIHARNNQASVGRILESGLEKIGKPADEVERNLETTTNLEITKMEQYTGYLGIIAGIAPMLGFIGTISGVIKIFYNISLADNISIGIISGGLYQKMICSGAGLIVGVLAYTAYHYLQMRIDRYTIKLQESLIQFLKAF